MAQLRHPVADQKLRNNRTSLRHNRVAPRQRLPQTVILQTPPPHKLDVWLPRFANFTQVALLALTVGGFYFTVLPLYQKALLDEAYARKEIELKQVTASLEVKYAKLRGVAVRGFVINADADCSGFSEMTRSPFDNTKAKASVRTNAFTIDVKKCLLDHEAKAPSLSELRTDDRAFFRTAFVEAADQIVKLQSDAVASYARADDDINDSNIDEYASKRELSARMLVFLAKHMQITPEAVAAHKRKSAVEELRAQRIDGYRSAMRNKLHGLTKVKWPTPPQ